MFQQEEKGHKTKIILASASPRREQIFRNLGLDFEVSVPNGIMEQKSGDPSKIAVGNSILKARDVLENMKTRGIQYLISGFDTIVYLGKKIFGKPLDMDEAYFFIETLSGKVHRVVTGICIIDSVSGRCLIGNEISRVKFKALKPDEIENYLARETVLDKAGAYNIGGSGALLIDKVQGCLYNIIGIPVFEYISLLERFDYKILYHPKE